MCVIRGKILPLKNLKQYNTENNQYFPKRYPKDNCFSEALTETKYNSQDIADIENGTSSKTNPAKVNS